MSIHPENAGGHDDYGASLAPGERSLAPYAANAVPSRGRFHPEPECNTRSPAQRDRDRILHSTAFRRLTYKTQVFLFHEGDHYRSRLTHSLEVAQIARTVARQLRLDEDLAEALALAHDLGHSPFGHAGERALDAAMSSYGGFDHNAQSIRAVTRLERKYIAFDGLNLTWETLEGLAKHNGPVTDEGSAIARVGAGLSQWKDLELTSWASAEAQVASLADEIAYLSHDVDDGLRAKLIAFRELESIPLAGEAAAEVRALQGKPGEGRRIYEITRRMIAMMVADLVTETRARLAALHPESPDDIRHANRAVAAFSPGMVAAIEGLRSYLFAHVYRHDRVMHVMHGAEQIVRDLFSRYHADISTLPDTWRTAAANLSERDRARLISDFVAGMTDRYAIGQHRQLFDHTPDLG
jgi:dGTPase